jgi:hypothetical protein
VITESRWKIFEVETMKQKLKEVGKKIASTILMPAILAGVIAVSPRLQ